MAEEHRKADFKVRLSPEARAILDSLVAESRRTYAAEVEMAIEAWAKHLSKQKTKTT